MKQLQPRGARRAIAVATLAGLALRLAFGLGYWVGKPLTHDELEYLALARSLEAGDGFRYPADAGDPDPERFGRAPGYPFFLSLVAGADALDADPPTAPRPIKMTQAFVAVAIVPMLGVLAWRAAGPLAGAVAAALAAVYPPLVWIPAYVLSEALYSVLALLSVLVLGLAIDRREPPRSGRTTILVAALAGLTGGLAALTRPATIVFLAMAVLWIALRSNRALAGAFLLGAVVTIAPWTARNIGEHGRLVLIASEGGITFWTGNHPLARGEGDMAANPAIKQANLELRKRHPGLSPEELEPIYYREALRSIGEHPVRWMGLVARKAFYLVVPAGPSYTLHSRRYQLASIVPYLVVLPFAVGGAWQLVRTGTPLSALWLMAGSAALTSLLFFPQERFRIPVIDPTLVVCAAAFIASAITPRRCAGGGS